MKKYHNYMLPININELLEHNRIESNRIEYMVGTIKCSQIINSDEYFDLFVAK